MKFQANKHAASYWTNAIFAFFLSLGFFELSVGGPNWLTTLAFSGALIYFVIFSVWNYQNWKLKNYLNSESFRSKLKTVIVPAVEGNYTYKNTIAQFKAQDFYKAMQFRPQRNSQNGEIVLTIIPAEIELFRGFVKDFKVSIYFGVPDDGLTDEPLAYRWESELLDTTLDPIIEN